MFSWKDPVLEWTVLSLVIGLLTVSHWRGLWTLFDIRTCHQSSNATMANDNSFCFASTLPEKRVNSAMLSYVVGVVRTIIGCLAMWLGGWKTTGKKVAFSLGVLRIVIIHILGLAAVSTRLGVWYLTDQWIMPSDPIALYWVTSAMGAVGA